MNRSKPQLIVLSIMLLAVAGCATTRFNVTMQDELGRPIDDRAMGVKDLAQVLDEQYSMLAAEQYKRCRALSLVVEEIWPTSQESLSQARRLSAWATVFLYSENPVGLTSLENERRNLLILATASAEFSEVSGVWGGEAALVSRAIDARVLDKEAFSAFVRSMRASTDDFASDGGLSDRKTAIEAIKRLHPDWSRTVGLDRLAVFPWRQFIR